MGKSLYIREIRRPYIASSLPHLLYIPSRHLPITDMPFSWTQISIAIDSGGSPHRRSNTAAVRTTKRATSTCGSGLPHACACPAKYNGDVRCHAARRCIQSTEAVICMVAFGNSSTHFRWRIKAIGTFKGGPPAP